MIELSELIRDATIGRRNDRGRANADFGDVFSLFQPENLLDAFKRLLDLTKKVRNDAIELSQRLQP
jgi:hypothetical protein